MEQSLKIFKISHSESQISKEGALYPVFHTAMLVKFVYKGESVVFYAFRPDHTAVIALALQFSPVLTIP